MRGYTPPELANFAALAACWSYFKFYTVGLRRLEWNMLRVVPRSSVSVLFCDRLGCGKSDNVARVEE